MWLELVTAYAPTPSGIEMPGQLRPAFAIAQWGYGDPENLATGTENGTGTESAQGERERGTEDRDTALPAHVTDRDHERTMVGHVLDPLEVTEPRADVVSSVIAMVEGLTLSACLGRLTPELGDRARDHSRDQAQTCCRPPRSGRLSAGGLPACGRASPAGAPAHPRPASRTARGVVRVGG